VPLCALLVLLCLYRYATTAFAPAPSAMSTGTAAATAAAKAAAAAATAAAAAAGGRSSLIFLHGLGDAGSSWAFLKGELSPRLPAMRFSFPNSPTQHVSLAGGPMPSWMDLDSLPVTAATPEDREGFESSTKLVHRLIDAEVAAGVPANRVYLGGFSQGAPAAAPSTSCATKGAHARADAHGTHSRLHMHTHARTHTHTSAGGAMSLYAGIKYPQTLGGIICFSGWLPDGLWEKELSGLPGVTNNKFLVIHGTHDSKVLYERGTSARDRLTEAQAEYVEFHDFEGDHSFFPPALEWIEDFLS
jgi:predicted esterase